MGEINLATKFTLFRIGIAPLIVILLAFPNPYTAFFAAIAFGAGGITDYLDGHLARTTNSVTPVGKLLDPIADKVLMISVLIPMVALGRVWAWLAALMLAREFAVTGVRMMAASRNLIIPADWRGKYKTGFEIAAMEFLILQWDIVILHFQTIGTTLLLIALFYSLWGAYHYFSEFASTFEE